MHLLKKYWRVLQLLEHYQLARGERTRQWKLPRGKLKNFFYYVIVLQGSSFFTFIQAKRTDLIIRQKLSIPTFFHNILNKKAQKRFFFNLTRISNHSPSSSSSSWGQEELRACSPPRLASFTGWLHLVRLVSLSMLTTSYIFLFTFWFSNCKLTAVGGNGCQKKTNLPRRSKLALTARTSTRKSMHLSRILRTIDDDVQRKISTRPLIGRTTMSLRLYSVSMVSHTNKPIAEEKKESRTSRNEPRAVSRRSSRAGSSSRNTRTSRTVERSGPWSRSRTWPAPGSLV